jgi:hypothetical protein
MTIYRTVTKVMNLSQNENIGQIPTEKEFKGSVQ